MISQSSEDVLRYADEKKVSAPQESIQIAKRYLQNSGLSESKKCAVYLVLAESYFYLQQYDEAIDYVYKIEENNCHFKTENLFLLKTGIYQSLDLKAYKDNTAKQIEELLTEDYPDYKINKEQWFLFNEYLSLAAISKTGKPNKEQVKKLKNQNYLSEYNYFVDIEVLLTAWDQSKEYDFLKNYKEAAGLSTDDAEHIYYRYFALYDAQRIFYLGNDIEAHQLLEKTLDFIQDFDELSFYKRDIYRTLIDINVQNENKEAVIRYRKSEIKYSGRTDLILTNALNKFFTHRTALNSNAQKEEISSYRLGRNVAVYFGSGIILFLVVYLFRLKWLNKHYREIAEYIQKMESKQSITSKNIAKTKAAVNKFKVSKEAEKQILSGLEKFEAEKMFLQKNISLAFVANELRMNTKYLSEILNSRLNENFNAYINRLRIEYIVNKLKNEPEYLKYKISYLAEITGYASHSSFTTAFKAITGVPPTTFITYLKRKT